MHVYKSTNNKPIHISQLQKFITIYLVYICGNFFYRCKFSEKNQFIFNAMLIACKCMSLCKKLDCDIKSEPPYHVTTLHRKEISFFVIN
jgi:hypothetical protein